MLHVHIFKSCRISTTYLYAQNESLNWRYTVLKHKVFQLYLYCNHIQKTSKKLSPTVLHSLDCTKCPHPIKPMITGGAKQKKLKPLKCSTICK